MPSGTDEVVEDGDIGPHLEGLQIGPHVNGLPNGRSDASESDAMSQPPLPADSDAAGGTSRTAPQPPPSLADLEKAIREVFSVNQLSSRSDEQEAVKQLMWGVPPRHRQAAMDMLKSERNLHQHPNIPRQLVKGLRPCKECHRMGHAGQPCPSLNTEGDGDAAAAVDGGTDVATAKAKKKKTSKKAQREKQAAEDAAKAEMQGGNAAVAAAGDDAAKDSSSDAKATSRPKSQQQASESEESDQAKSDAEGDDDMLARMAAMVAQKSAKGGKAAAAPAKSSSSAAKAAVDGAETASNTSSAKSGPQSEQARGRSGKGGNQQEPGGSRGAKGRGDGDAVPSPPPAAERLAGTSSRDAARQQRVKATENCFTCGQAGHFKVDCPQAYRNRPPPPASPSKEAAAQPSFRPSPPPSPQPASSASLEQRVSGPVTPPSASGGYGGIRLPETLDVSSGGDDGDVEKVLLGYLGISGETSASAAAESAWGGASNNWNPPQAYAPGQPHPLAELPPAPKVAVPRPDFDDEEMQKAMAASLEQQARPVGLLRSTRAGPAEASAAGLANETGEYNCFLNAIIQCLWQQSVFRRRMLSFDTSSLANMDGSHRIVKALVGLFQALGANEQARQDAAAAGRPPPADRAVMSPNELREAIAERHAFRLGEMNDASEVLLALYDSLAEVGQEEIAKESFGMEVTEGVRCRMCGKHTHRNNYVQYFQNVSAAGLRQQYEEEDKSSPKPLGARLHKIDGQQHKTCDTDEGGCGVKNHVGLYVHAAPEVFTLELGWHRLTEASQDIAATLETIDTFFDPADLYLALTPGNHTSRLRALVCYYGEHYQAIVLEPALQANGNQATWMLYDDANASRVGTQWTDVIDKCSSGKIQPSVLFFESVETGADDLL